MIANSLNLTVKSWYLHFIAGAFFPFTGIYVVTVSPDLYPGLNKLLGTAFILSGLVFSVFSVRNHSKIAGWGWYIVYGILITGMGFYLSGHQDESLFLPQDLPHYSGADYCLESLLNYKNTGIRPGGT